ncbi:MAG: beta-lactamase family protein [Verrucomicrobiae bacterium]|nr:beta-lactamase family protein [Verrucomicrobiae bacterium]
MRLGQAGIGSGVMVAAALSLAGMGAGGETAQGWEWTDALRAQVEAAMERWDRPGSPGVALVLVGEGRVLLERHWGMANLEHRVRIGSGTVFDSASVAKQFMGAAMAILVREGRVGLEDDVRRYLPEMPDFGETITLGHLLHHTGGLRDWPGMFRLGGMDLREPIDLEMILEMAGRARDLNFPPGERYLYSNTGYNLLAQVLERVTGHSLRAWTDERLFRPLGMVSTHFGEDPAETIPNRAEGYGPAGEGRFRRVMGPLAARGSSSLHTTIADLGRWLVEMETGSVLGRGTIELMEQPGRTRSGGRVEYGYGVALDRHRGRQVVVHTGSWAGYRSITWRVPEHRFALGILANVTTVDTTSLARRLTDLILGMDGTASEGRIDAPDREGTGEIDGAAWTDYEGTYRLGPGWLLTIRREGGRLVTQATREASAAMTPMGSGTFHVEAYRQGMEFVRDEESGLVTHLRYRGIRAPKLEGAETEAPRLQVLAGEYWSEELRAMHRVELHDGALRCWQGPYRATRLRPVAKDHFETGNGMSIEFRRHGNGHPVEMRYSAGRVLDVRFVRGDYPGESR